MLRNLRLLLPAALLALAAPLAAQDLPRDPLANAGVLPDVPADPAAVASAAPQENGDAPPRP